MANLDMKKITIPLSYFYIGATTLVPASSDVKAGTLIELDSKGVPTVPGWMYIGATIGQGTWEYTRDVIELAVEQVSGIPDGGLIYNNEGLNMTIPIAQLEYDKLQRALMADMYTAGTGKVLTLGGKTEPETFSVLLVAEHRAGKGLFHQFCIYKAINGQGVTFNFSKADAMTFEMQCRGLVDAGRDKGDQLGYVYLAPIAA